MNEKILKLRQEGKTYKEISKELNCSLATVSYHLGEGQKEKAKQRAYKNRDKNSLYQKMGHFHCNNKSKSSLQDRVKKFRTHKKYSFSLKDFLKKYQNELNNLICYLTGDKINLNNPSSYSFDHKIPHT